MKICVIRGVKKFTFKMKRSEKVRKVKQKVSDKWKELPLSSSELIERTNGKYYKPLDDDWTIKDCALSEKLVKERGVDIPYAELEVLFKRRNDILGDTPWSRTLGETLTSSDTRRESIVCIEQRQAFCHLWCSIYCSGRLIEMVVSAKWLGPHVRTGIWSAM